MPAVEKNLDYQNIFMTEHTYYQDEEEDNFPDICPNCHREYDEVDHEYQICHLCGFDNSKTENE